MQTTHHPHRALRVVIGLAIVLACVSAMRGAWAEDPAHARRAWTEGRADDAFRLLKAFLLQDPTDPAEILDAARLASEMKDAELIEHVQGRAEIASGEATDPRLELALGISYLALAEIRLVAGVPSPTLSSLFADAEAIATGLVADQAGTPFEQEGRLLHARTRQALGDVEGALAALDVEADWPAKRRLQAELRYERAVTKRLDGSGRPTPEGVEDLKAALSVLAGEKDFGARIKAAWAAHRIGDLEAARGHYVAAWALDHASTYPLRGLQSLAAGRPKLLVESLEEILEAAPEDVRAMDALAEAQLGLDTTSAILTLGRRIALDERDPAGWMLGARLFFAMKQWREVRKHARRAFDLDPTSREASGMLERLAHTVVGEDLEGAISVYEELVELKPDDSLLWNNYGLLLRDAVSPFTDTDPASGLQTIKEGAPSEVHELLARCLEVYRRAVSLVPEDLEEKTEYEVWILAGIVNDLGLMLHYFVDVQEPYEAERLYVRALVMTGYAYKDTYHPNLRRLYALVLPDRAWAWYRAAREARWAQMLERPRPGGGFDLVPDEAKRELAAEDARKLRARLARLLAEGAEEDGDPWPPEGE